MPSLITKGAMSAQAMGFGIINIESSAGSLSVIENSDIVSIDGTGISEPNLVIYYDAANSASYPGSGLNVTDLSGYNNNASFYSAVTFDTSNDGSWVLNGSYNYLLTSPYNPYSATIPSGTAARTLIAVFNPASTADQSVWGMGANFGTLDRSAIYLYNGKIVGEFQGLGVTSNYTFSTNQWIFVALTLPNNGLISQTQLYVNGALVPITLLGSDGYFNTINRYVLAGIVIGANDGIFNGKISFLQVYDGVASSTKIASVFNSIRGRYGI